MYWLLTENYVLNANILVFMLIHTELFSNVSGLGLMHCGLGLEKNWVSASSSASLFLASALASCPAGLVNINESYAGRIEEKPHSSLLHVVVN